MINLFLVRHDSFCFVRVYEISMVLKLVAEMKHFVKHFSTLRTTFVNVPYYVRGNIIHNDLDIPEVETIYIYIYTNIGV